MLLKNLEKSYSTHPKIGNTPRFRLCLTWNLTGLRCSIEKIIKNRKKNFLIKTFLKVCYGFIIYIAMLKNMYFFHRRGSYLVVLKFGNTFCVLCSIRGKQRKGCLLFCLFNRLEKIEKVSENKLCKKRSFILFDLF